MVARAGATRLAPVSLPRTMRSPRRSHLRAACCVYSRLFLRAPWPRGKAPSGMLRITRRSPSAAAYPKRHLRAVTILLRPLYVETGLLCQRSCHRPREQFVFPTDGKVVSPGYPLPFVLITQVLAIRCGTQPMRRSQARHCQMLLFRPGDAYRPPTRPVSPNVADPHAPPRPIL